jgi:membrane protease YdiL (CAAX protease family)
MFADACLATIPTLLIALTLIHSGLTRKEIYLTPGNLKARLARTTIPWAILAPVILLLMAFGLTAQLHYIMGKSHTPTHLPWSSIAAIAIPFAVINAFHEEFRFRFVLLAHGRRALGPRTALWITSLNFGLAHYGSGHPGGPTGAITTTLFGLLLARSLYDTEGGLIAWLTHIAADIIIMTVVLLHA